MSTVAEQAAKREEVANFEMPKVLQGDTVLWYRHGKKGGLPPEMATVLKHSRRSLRVKTLVGERVLDAVRHVNDPRLSDGPDLREDGAWEHSPHFLAIQAMKRTIDAQQAIITQFEMRLGQLEKKSSSK